ncbi:MAG: SDR family NAD(P)-dependent oxidoreductase [Chloroflexi bacterium]|nr:SDR family NAD(P)-dependent oxidoreductase [Chloroflexota bacterium]
MSDVELRGKRVLVVGGETALGRAVVIGLAEAGADVAIVSLTSETKAEFAINSALNELWALQRQGLALAIDAADAEQVRAAVERADRELGRLELAAVVSGVGTVAVEALKAAMAERGVVVLSPEVDASEALEAVLAGL